MLNSIASIGGCQARSEPTKYQSSAIDQKHAQMKSPWRSMGEGEQGKKPLNSPAVKGGHQELRLSLVESGMFLRAGRARIPDLTKILIYTII